MNLQHLFIESDKALDPQAFVLAPENVIPVAAEMVKGSCHLEATVRGCQKALSLIEESVASENLYLDEKEVGWIDIIKQGLDTIPDNEEQFIEEMVPTLDDSKIALAEYGLA